MKLVACDPENIPPWIFPVALPHYPDPGIGTDFPLSKEADFWALAQALKLTLASDQVLLSQNSGCDVGFSHDAPDTVPEVNPEIVRKIASFQPHERWRLAEQWAHNRFNKRPSQEVLNTHKQLLKKLCEFAAIAIESNYIMVLVEPY